MAQLVASQTWEQEVAGPSWAWPIFFQRIDDSHCDRNDCDRIHSFLTATCCLDNDYVGKQPVAWKECCGEYWLKELGKAWIDAQAATI